MHVYEMRYAYEMHAYEMHAYEMHAYKMHAYEMQAQEMQAYEGFASASERRGTAVLGPGTVSASSHMGFRHHRGVLKTTI